MKPNSGTYALVLRCPRRAQASIGRLGRLALQPGHYLYIGSAFGLGGVSARVLRHCRKVKSKHWHIDYLQGVVKPIWAWYTYDPVHLEHRWAQAVGRMAEMTPIGGFGCSDCGCPAHLFHTAMPPDEIRFARAVGGPVETWFCQGTG